MNIFKRIIKLVVFTCTLLITMLLLINIPVAVSLRLLPKTSHHNDQEGPPEIWLAGYSETDSLVSVLPDDQFRSQNQFTNELISKNGSDFVVNEDVTQVVFACEADFPITWLFPFPEQMKQQKQELIYTKEYRSSQFTLNSGSPVNTKYKILVVLRSIRGLLQFLCSNITCTSVENGPIVQSSIYVYYVAQDAIENQGKTLDVFLEPTKQQSQSFHPLPYLHLGPPLVLPCRPASPDIKLVLEKQQFVPTLHANHTSTMEPMWNSVHLSEKYMTFDPKVGFTVQRGIFYRDLIYGLYRCSVGINSNDDDGGGDALVGDVTQFVLVNVTNNRKEEKHLNFQPRSIFRGTAHLNFVDWESGFLSSRCCSDLPDKPPKFHTSYCSNPLDCQLIKDHILEKVANEVEGKQLRKNTLISAFDRLNDSSDCSRNILYAGSTVTVCQGENIDYAEQFVDLFFSEVGGPLTNRSKRVEEQEKEDELIGAQLDRNHDMEYTQLTRYKTLSMANLATTSEKIFLTAGRRISNRKLIKQQENLGPGIPFRVIRGGTGDKDFQDLDFLIDDLEDYIRTQRRSAYVVEYDRDEFYVGEPLLFMCFGIKYFYASSGGKGGAHLRLNWQNGTKTILEFGVTDENRRVVSTDKKLRKYGETQYTVCLSGKADIVNGDSRQLTSVFGRTILAEKGMTSVDCWMPHRNSSSWDKISRTFKMKASVAPRFVESEEEIVYFYLGDIKGQVVTCTVVDAKPFPSRVNILKDGKPLRLKVHKTGKKIEQDKMDHGVVVGNPKNDSSSEETETPDEKNDRIIMRIKFRKVRHDIQGEYECTSTNINGTARRLIKVYVIEKPSMVLPIFLGIAGILSLVFVGLGLKHWWDRRIVLSLQTNHQL